MVDCSRRFTSRSGFANHQKKHKEELLKKNESEVQPVLKDESLIPSFVLCMEFKVVVRQLPKKAIRRLMFLLVRFLVVLKRLRIRIA